MARVLHNVVGLIALLAITAPHTASAIRVYWNTNTGPIVPPTTTPVPVPQPPFRDPAPIWEDQQEDVPNPNPYVYILPPPSRPKYNDITVQRKQNQQELTTAAAQPSSVTPTTTTTSTQAPVTGRIIERPSQNQLVPHQQQQQTVPSLAVQYVPNQGYKYYAVVAPAKSAYLKTNDAQLGKAEQYDKPNGRYNAKLKKYKAYEKVKYVPYYVYFDEAKQQYVWSSVAPKTVPVPNKIA